LAAEGDNYVAIIGFGSGARIVCNFTNTLAELNQAIDIMGSGGGTNVTAGIQTASGLFATGGVPDDAIKNVVIMSDGQPDNAATATAAAKALWDDYNVYSLGFFHSLSGNAKVNAEKFLKGLQDAGYYPVENGDELDFEFGNIGEDITGEGNYPIVFIPGIMGSHLFEVKHFIFSYDNCVWPPNMVFEGNKLKITNTNPLHVRPYENQQGLDAWNTNKEVAGKDEREYGALGTYKEIIDRLCAEFPSRPVYFFSYDWRLGNGENAIELKAFIQSLTGEADGNGKVDLVCHSMGGILASSYYEANSDDHRTNKIITAGTPYEGSPYAFGAVLNGDISSDWIQNLGLSVLARWTTEIKKQYLSVAQLAPTAEYNNKAISMKYGYVDCDDDLYRRICVGIFGDDNTAAGKKFQVELRGGTGYNVLLDHPNAYFIVGKGGNSVDTVVSYVFPVEDVGFSDDSADLNYAVDLEYGIGGDGDGKVPYLSASMINTATAALDGTGSGRQYIFATDHGGLVGHPDKGRRSEVKDEAQQSLKKIIGILSGDYTKPGDPAPYTRKKTVIRIACPVDATVSKGSEILASAPSVFNDVSSFGRMDIIGHDGEIKMFCVDDDTFPVKLEGTGEGTMDYAIRFFDENNQLIEERSFEDVTITDKTVITTDTSRGGTTTLNVDENGDGVVDYTLDNNDDGGSGNGGDNGNGSGGGCSAGLGGFGIIILAGFLALKKRRA
jgi:pimeloyl-ACP methyl ester carboxylesterase